MNRRQFISNGACAIAGTLVSTILRAETFLSIEQAKQVIWGDTSMSSIPVILSKAQMSAIKESSKTKVRNKKMNVWKVQNGGWFILDQVIGKHENIDIAVGLDEQGKVKGIEVLVYRETYGHEIRNPKWRTQFHGRGHTEVLKLDKQIQNISGATLSCRHITDAMNRLTHTWDQVLRHL